jgi:hypothetical protein
MKNVNTVIAFAILMFSAQAQALIIEADVTPSVVPGITCDAGDTICETALTSNNTAEITAFVERDYGTLLYKQAGSEEEGAFASAYTTEWTELDGDGEPSGAVITLNEGFDPIICPECYIMVKDGELGDPSWYLFDLGDWDGLELILTGFWDGEGVKGAISGFEIYGGEHNVPEPGVLALLGLGLAGMFITRRKAQY